MEIPNKKQLKFSVLLTNKDIKANKLLLFWKYCVVFPYSILYILYFINVLFCVFGGILFCFSPQCFATCCVAIFVLGKRQDWVVQENVLQFMCSICCSPLSVIRHRWHRLSCLQVWRSRYPFSFESGYHFRCVGTCKTHLTGYFPSEKGLFISEY